MFKLDSIIPENLYADYLTMNLQENAKLDPEILKRVKQTIIRTLKLNVAPDQIGLNDVLFGVMPGADSIAMLEVFASLENEFRVDFLNQDIGSDTLANVRGIAHFIQRRLSDQE